MLSLMSWSGGGAAVSKNRRGKNQAQEEGEEEEERRGRGAAAASLAKWRPVTAALLARARQHLPNSPGPCCSP
jgi:hypothetical protein